MWRILNVETTHILLIIAKHWTNLWIFIILEHFTRDDNKEISTYGYLWVHRRKQAKYLANNNFSSFSTLFLSIYSNINGWLLYQAYLMRKCSKVTLSSDALNGAIYACIIVYYVHNSRWYSVDDDVKWAIFRFLAHTT